MTRTPTWRCICGASGTSEASAQRHARDCDRMGMPGTSTHPNVTYRREETK